MLVKILATTAVVFITGCSNQKSSNGGIEPAATQSEDVASFKDPSMTSSPSNEVLTSSKESDSRDGLSDAGSSPATQSSGVSAFHDPSGIRPPQKKAVSFSQASDSREGSTDSESVSSSVDLPNRHEEVKPHSRRAPPPKESRPSIVAGTGPRNARPRTGHASFAKSYSPEAFRRPRNPSPPIPETQLTETHDSQDHASGFPLAFRQDDVRSEISASDLSEYSLPWESESFDSERDTEDSQEDSEYSNVNEGDLELESFTSETNRDGLVESDSLRLFRSQQAGLASVEQLTDQLENARDDFVSISREIADLIPSLATTTAVGRSLEHLGNYWFATAQQYLAEHPESVGAIEDVFSKIKTRLLVEEQELDFQKQIDAIKARFAARTPGKVTLRSRVERHEALDPQDQAVLDQCIRVHSAQDLLHAMQSVEIRVSSSTVPKNMALACSGTIDMVIQRSYAVRDLEDCRTELRNINGALDILEELSHTLSMPELRDQVAVHKTRVRIRESSLTWEQTI